MVTVIAGRMCIDFGRCGVALVVSQTVLALMEMRETSQVQQKAKHRQK